MKSLVMVYFEISHVDIDECAIGAHECQQHCQNLPGGFSCYCDTGYLLQDNGKDCESETIFFNVYRKCMFCPLAHRFSWSKDVIIVDSETKMNGCN